MLYQYLSLFIMYQGSKRRLVQFDQDTYGKPVLQLVLVDMDLKVDLQNAVSIYLQSSDVSLLNYLVTQFAVKKSLKVGGAFW